MTLPLAGSRGARAPKARGEEKGIRLRRLMALSADDLSGEAGIRLAPADLNRSQGWEHPTARRVAFEEPLSMGGLRPVTDVQVREAISRYYGCRRIPRIESGELRRAATAELNFTRDQTPTTSRLIGTADELVRRLED